MYAGIYAAREWYAQGAALFYHSHTTTPAFIRVRSSRAHAARSPSATFYHTPARLRKGE
jgi:hypothetical protein